MKQFTRKQYMNKECTYREYYAQYVTPAIKRTVARTFGVDHLAKALKEDEHLNTISLPRWDRLAPTIYGHIADMNYRKGEGRSRSLMEGVCVLKEAAIQLVEENENAE